MTTVGSEAPRVRISSGDDVVEHAKRVVKALSPADARALRRLAALRIPEPRRVLLAAKKSKLPLSFAAALVLEQGDLLHGAALVPSFQKMSVFMRKLGTHDGAVAYSRGMPDAGAFVKRFEQRQRELAVSLGEKLPRPAKVVVNPRNWWKRYVVGDTDCERHCSPRSRTSAKTSASRSTCARDAARAQSNSTSTTSTSPGRATAPRSRTRTHGTSAASPPTAPSEPTATAPTSATSAGARDAMKKRGLCLCVAGETWHVQIGNNWLA